MMAPDIAAIVINAYSFVTFFIIIAASSLVLIPGCSILIASYASFLNSIRGLFFLMILVLAASLIGDYSVYFLARRFSNKIRNILRRFSWFSKNEQRTRQALRKNEFSFVFFSRFLVSGTGPVANYVYGFEKLDKRKFIIAVLLGEMVYSIIYASIGYIFKDTWRDLISTLQYSFIIFAFAVLAIYIFYKIARFYSKK